MVEIVENDADGRSVIVGEVAHEVEDLGLIAQVEVVRRFVEQQDPGLLCQAGGQPDALKLAAGELIDGTLGHRVGAGQFQSLIDRGPVSIGEGSEAAPVRVATEGDDLTHTQPGRMRSGLGEQSDRTGEFACRQRGRRSGRPRRGDGDLAGADRMQTSQGPQHGRLPAAVGSDECRDPTGSD